MGGFRSADGPLSEGGDSWFGGREGAAKVVNNGFSAGGQDSSVSPRLVMYSNRYCDQGAHLGVIPRWHCVGARGTWDNWDFDVEDEGICSAFKDGFQG